MLSEEDKRIRNLQAVRKYREMHREEYNQRQNDLYHNNKEMINEKRRKKNNEKKRIPKIDTI